MRKINEENERIKRKFLLYKREADGKDAATIAKIASALLRFEKSINYKSFKSFNHEQVASFKRKLTREKNERTGKPLGKSTIDAILRELRSFIRFLAGQQGYKSRIAYCDAAYFNNNAKDSRVAHAHRNTRYPTLEQAKHAFNQMPAETDIEFRNKALFAFIMLTGVRVTAASSLKLKHIDLTDGHVFQDAREVRTKNSKTFTTWFLPIDSDYKTCFYAWVNYLRTEKLFGNDDALFPKPDIQHVKGKGFQIVGFSRDCYAGSTKIRDIIKQAFNNAGLTAYAPHSFRKTIVSWGTKAYPDHISWKAFCLNIGHNDTATAIHSYLPISPEQQANLIKGKQNRR
ncbi:MAG: site-specific integrase [Rhizobiaceae bacterium]